MLLQVSIQHSTIFGDCFCGHIKSAIMSKNNNVFCIMAGEDKLDRKNYPLWWSYMTLHVLVAKALWNVVIGVEMRLASCEEYVGSTGIMEDDSGASSSMAAPIVVPATQEQRRWDVRDAQEHALLALSVKHGIIPHIRSCRIAKDAWDTLATFYQIFNEANVAYFCKQLESNHMNEGDSMEFFLVKIKSLRSN